LPIKYKFIGRVITDGRVTIPLVIRTLLRIKDGDLVEIEIEKAHVERQAKQ
jgi:bifunctional DNA-binding transcriptional regulator/antitoxin component of YhaV-PrlF toxin-antitoxin module